MAKQRHPASYRSTLTLANPSSPVPSYAGPHQGWTATSSAPFTYRRIRSPCQSPVAGIINHQSLSLDLCSLCAGKCFSVLINQQPSTGAPCTLSTTRTGTKALRFDTVAVAHEDNFPASCQCHSGFPVLHSGVGIKGIGHRNQNTRESELDNACRVCSCAFVDFFVLVVDTTVQ